MKLRSVKSIGEVIRKLNAHAPLGASERWDNVGLILGDPEWETSGVIVSIDLTQESIECAIQKGFRLIITHHPCIFPKSKGVSQLVAGSLAFEALRHQIAVASYHTNFDQCALEVVQKVSSGLGVEVKGRLIEDPSESLMKLVTFVPESHLEQVREAICRAGAGHVGCYDTCTFGVLGEGSFRGSKDTRPFIGQPGVLEKVPEIRLETVFPKGLKSPVLSALRAAHPYEEVAYDVSAVEQHQLGRGVISGLGYGFWGEFPSPKPFSEFAKGVRNLFNINGFWITNPTPSTVSRIGFVAGKGSSFIEAALAVNCDLLITGEAGYHSALQGARLGMAVMELGHRESEKFFMEVMKEWLSDPGFQVVDIQTPTQLIWSGGMK